MYIAPGKLCIELYNVFERFYGGGNNVVASIKKKKISKRYPITKLPEIKPDSGIFLYFL